MGERLAVDGPVGALARHHGERVGSAVRDRASRAVDDPGGAEWPPKTPWSMPPWSSAWAVGDLDRGAGGDHVDAERVGVGRGTGVAPAGAALPERRSVATPGTSTGWSASAPGKSASGRLRAGVRTRSPTEVSRRGSVEAGRVVEGAHLGPDGVDGQRAEGVRTPRSTDGDRVVRVRCGDAVAVGGPDPGRTPEAVPRPGTTTSATSLAWVTPARSVQPMAWNAEVSEPAGTWPPVTRVP